LIEGVGKWDEPFDRVISASGTDKDTYNKTAFVVMRWTKTPKRRFYKDRGRLRPSGDLKSHAYEKLYARCFLSRQNPVFRKRHF